jgi:hypothetical protein
VKIAFPLEYFDWMLNIKLSVDRDRIKVYVELVGDSFHIHMSLDNHAEISMRRSVNKFRSQPSQLSWGRFELSVWDTGPAAALPILIELSTSQLRLEWNFITDIIEMCEHMKNSMAFMPTNVDLLQLS